MKTRRERIIIFALSLVLAAILEFITMKLLIDYNVWTGIISIVLYFTIFVFILVDGYYAIKVKDNYHKHALIKDILILFIIIIFFYFCGIINPFIKLFF